MSKVTTASEDQLKTALRRQVKHAGTQNLVIQNLSAQLGSAGNVIEKIKKLKNQIEEGSMMYETFYDEVSRVLKNFEKTTVRNQNAFKRGQNEQ